MRVKWEKDNTSKYIVLINDLKGQGETKFQALTDLLQNLLQIPNSEEVAEAIIIEAGQLAVDDTMPDVAQDYYDLGYKVGYLKAKRGLQ